MSANISEQDHELLSAYIDGDLTDAERLGLEIRLDAETDLRRELESMRQTVALVNQLTRLKAPRDFTLALPPQKVIRKLPLFLTGTFSALSAAAAVLLLLFGGYLLVGSSMNSATMQTMSVALQATTVLELGDEAFLQTAAPQLTVTSAAPEAADQIMQSSIALTPTAEVPPQGGMLNTAPAANANSGGGADADQIQDAQQSAPVNPDSEIEQATQTELFSFEAVTEEPEVDDTLMMAVPKETVEDGFDDEDALTLQPLPYATDIAGMAAPAVQPTQVAAGEITTNAEESADGAPADEQVQRQTVLPTLTFPANMPQPTDAVSGGRARVNTISSSTVALIALGVGLVLLVVALVTTVARRNARA